ncbi:DUF2975 domain-containing protein [Flavobacterium sp. LB3P45]|uniref:DUF2975 domain-containing protein n=1 Tax=Flavobacterium fructosi TaxID=3230416 RepID=A0ABW6HNJ7_9FLAO
MSIKKDTFLKALQVVLCILFIDICIEAGGFIFNTFFILVINPVDANKFWAEVNLSELYNYNQSYFITVTSLMIIVALMRPVMFYIIAKIFHHKILNLLQPFNETVRHFILKTAYLALGIGFLSFWGAKYIQDLVNQGMQMPDLQHLRLGGADVWLFMAVILFGIAQIFKKGIEIQNENDLTV